MPIFSGGGGGGGAPFNGGTITQPLVIAVTDPATIPLQVIMPAGASAAGANWLRVLGENGDNVCIMGCAGDLALFADKVTPANGGGGVALWPTAGNPKWLAYADDGTGAPVPLNTRPAASSAPTLTLGTAFHNTLGFDVLMVVYLSCTVNTSVVMQLGVGPTTTPTQQTIITGLTATGIWTVPFYLPNTYYALLSKSGTGTVAIDGQIAIPV